MFVQQINPWDDYRAQAAYVRTRDHDVRIRPETWDAYLKRFKDRFKAFEALFEDVTAVSRMAAILKKDLEEL